MTSYVTDFAGADADPIGGDWEDALSNGGNLRRNSNGVAGSNAGGGMSNVAKVLNAVATFGTTYQSSEVTLGPDSGGELFGPSVLASPTGAYIVRLFGGVSGTAGGSWRKYDGAADNYVADIANPLGAVPGDTFKLVAERDVPSAGQLTLTLLKNGASFDSRVETTGVLTVGAPAVYAAWGTGNTIDAARLADVPAASVSVSGATSISHGQTVALTIANADLGDRTITIRQGAMVLTIAEEAGGTNTACNIIAAMERVDPLPSIFRNVSASIRVTRISDGDYAQYSFTPVDPSQQTSVILTSIEPVSAYRITAVPDLVAGDHLHARSVGGVGSLPAGLVLNADATFSEDSAVNFDVRSQDAATGVLSAWALQTVFVGVAPSITTQPTNQTVAEGATATFSITATGDAPLTYQWQKNFVDIVGATSATYVTPTTVLGDNGSTYRCRVTNAYGFVNSNTATLTVSAVSPGDIIPPSVPTGLVATVIDQTRVHLSWNPSTDTGGSGLSGYRIYRNGFPIGSSPVASLVDSTIIASGSYTYQVSAFDYAGNESDLSLPPVLVDNLQIIIPQSYIMDSGFGVVRRRRRFH